MLKNGVDVQVQQNKIQLDRKYMRGMGGISGSPCFFTTKKGYHGVISVFNSVNQNLVKLNADTVK